MPILQVKHIKFRYRQDWVLEDISIDVSNGEIVGIIGPNGSGKTTLLKIMDRILLPQEGEIKIDGININSMKHNELARIIAVVPQEIPLIFPFSVEEIVLMGRSPHLGKLRFEGKIDYKIARDAMNMADIGTLANRKITELSGGERQRVWIARALAQKPQIILLDEFTVFLDIKHQIALFELIKNLNRTNNLTIIMITHDLNMISQYTNRIIMLNAGKIHAMGTPEEVITRANIMAVYETDVLIDSNPKTGRPRVTLLGNKLDHGQYIY